MNNEHEHEQDVDALRDNIEETRARISGEIEAISDKLTPRHAKDVARSKLMDSGERAKHRMLDARDRAMTRVRTSAHSTADAARHAGQQLPVIVRENPIPVALVAVGATWLTIGAINRVRHRREMRSEQLVLPLEGDVPEAYGVGGEPYGVGGDRYGATEPYGGPGASTYPLEAGVASEEEGHRGERIEHAKRRLDEAKGAARERIGMARTRAREKAHDVREKAGAYAEKGRHGAIQARDRSMDAFERNPLVFGGVCLLTGVGLGMLLPHTRREDRTLGPRRERVMDRAKLAAHDAKDAAVHSAKEGLRAAKETAREDLEKQHY